MSVKEITSCKFLGTQVKSHDFAFDIMSCQLLSLTDGFKRFDFYHSIGYFHIHNNLNTFQSELLIVSLFFSLEDTSENKNNKTRERQIKQNVRLSIVWISNI